MKKSELKKRLTEIYDKNIKHRSFLEERHILKCMMEAYELGSNGVKTPKIKKKNKKRKGFFGSFINFMKNP